MTDRAEAFDQWWELAVMNGILPSTTQKLAREAYYAAWGGGGEIERLRALHQEAYVEIEHLRSKIASLTGREGRE